MGMQNDFGFGGFDRCPACGSDRLLAVFGDEWANFLCEACDQYWHVSMGWAQRVDLESVDTRAAADVLDLRSDTTTTV